MKVILCLALFASAAYGQVGRIVGGQPATPGQFPSQVSLQVSFFGHSCGGSILDANTILTTAVCCNYEPENLEVVAGIIYLDTPSENKQSRLVSSIIRNEEWNEDTFYDNDICLLKLETPLALDGETVAAIQLPQDGDSNQNGGEVVTISGWGKLDEGDATTPVFLRFAEVDIVDQDECIEIYGPIINEGMICAGANGRDACAGDAGGPMLCGNPDDRILCGIDSFVRFSKVSFD